MLLNMNNMKKEIIPMQNKKIKRLKKSGSLVLAAMMMVLSSNIIALASSPQYVSEEEIGIDVYYPEDLLRASSSIIEGDPVSGGGGTLWVTWKGGVAFRANYDHSSKEHRSSVSNDHLTVRRSEWTEKGKTAISPWLDQTLSNNRAYYSTR